MKPQNNQPTSDKELDDNILANAADAAKAFVETPQPTNDKTKDVPSLVNTLPQKPIEQVAKPSSTQQSNAPSPLVTNKPQPIQDKAVFATFDTQTATSQKNINGPHPGEPVSFSQMSKKRNWLFVPLLLLVVVVILGGAGAGFYYGYWTTADTVYSRFQKNLASITNESIKTNTDTLTSYAYDLKVDANQNSENILNISSAGRAEESGFDSSSDISFRGSDINIAGRFVIQDDTSPYTLYLKFKGISEFMKTSGLDDSLGSSSSDILAEYDDLWISVDLLKTISGNKEDNTAALTKENYQELWTAIEPTVNKKIIGTNKDSGIFRFTNPRSEDVAGLKTWAYDMTFDKDAMSEAIDDIISAVNATSLSDAQKNDFKTSLENVKENIEPETIPLYTKNNTSTIWLEKNSANIVRIRASEESLFNNEVTSKTTTEISVTKFSLKYIDMEAKYTNGIDESDLTEVTSRIKIDNSTKEISLDGSYGTQVDGYTYTLNLKPETNTEPITKPANAIDYKTVFERLGAVD